ncbi:MAG TPA: AAA family ATPase [Gemmatales bacterium]|nr:AAA family ATPase [Gemmatales bacterium]HMP59601.1 AAA family ATPase [Gemmatales bacterium]
MARKPRSSPGPYLLYLELLRDRIRDANRFPYNLPALRELTRLSFHPRVTFLVGENGSGKSTLLEVIAVESGMNAEGGSRNFNFSTRASHSALDQCIRLGKAAALPGDTFFLRAESFYNVATNIDQLDQDRSATAQLIDSYGGKSLHEQSHGESFFALFEHRFRDHGLYLMDEPEAALSPQRQLQFLALFHDYVTRGCQFVIATHSPIIMAYPDACIYLLAGDGLRPVAYTETEHYQVTRGFLSNPKRSLQLLMGAEPPTESD